MYFADGSKLLWLCSVLKFPSCAVEYFDDGSKETDRDPAHYNVPTVFLQAYFTDGSKETDRDPAHYT